MRIGQSAVLALDEQCGSTQRQQGTYAVQRHTGVKGLGRRDRRLRCIRLLPPDRGGAICVDVLEGHLVYRIALNIIVRMNLKRQRRSVLILSGVKVNIPLGSGLRPAAIAAVHLTDRNTLTDIFLNLLFRAAGRHRL